MSRYIQSNRITRAACGLMLLTTLMAVTGCGTVANLHEERPRPYGGVVGWGETTKSAIVELKKQDPPVAGLMVLLVGPAIVCDVALSAIADTITLPWVFYRDVQPGPALFTWALPKC